MKEKGGRHEIQIYGLRKQPDYGVCDVHACTHVCVCV